MEVESKAGQPLRGFPDHQNRKRKRRNICLAYVFANVATVLLMVILTLTVFKTKRAVVTVSSFSLEDIDVSVDIPMLRVYLNVTLGANMLVKNPNKVGFKYTNSSAWLKYRGEVVGEVPIEAGKIKADGTTSMNVTLTILADRLIFNPNLYSDVTAGILPLTSYTRISGKVRMLMFKIHVVSYSTCDINIDVTHRNLGNQTCHYKTKL